MLKKNSLGYVVFSREKDRYDGWLKIKQGNERGYPAGEEPKGKAVAKEPDKNKAASVQDKPAISDEEKVEKAAATKLEFARSMLRDGKADKAKTRLEEIVKLYPTTKAADEAKKELEKLGK
jgi:hypothetical protein